MESIYGSRKPDLEAVMQAVLNKIRKIRLQMAEELGMDPIEHLESRIKAEDSMREKCRRRGLPETPESALVHLYDAIGLRIVCAFVDDVYTIKNRLLETPGIDAAEEKDYIRNVKPNGYRSYHMIIRYDPAKDSAQRQEISENAGNPDDGSDEKTGGEKKTAREIPPGPADGRYYVEIQLRTISMDTWAALEHHLKYKKDIKGNIDLIEKELKRCADELASTDGSMQTLRDMIREL